MGAVDDVVTAVRAGEPVVIPTDTVYGLCGTPDREETVRRIARLKGRSETTPIALVASSVDALLDVLPELRGAPAVVARTLLPGPYTLVLPNPAERYRWMTGGNPRAIGVRVPALAGDPARVLSELRAVAATSANRHGEPDPRRLADVPTEILSACGAVLDGGELPGTPSTVLEFTGPEPRVIRAGAAPPGPALARAAEALGRMPQRK